MQLLLIKYLIIRESIYVFGNMFYQVKLYGVAYLQAMLLYRLPIQGYT